jgi:Holliday junction resolvasome RuvABC DNA-binding subunit
LPLTESLAAQLAQLIDAGISRNDALKQLAKMRGLSKKEAYRLLLEEKHNAESS